MKTAIAVAIGFSFVPSVLGIVGLYAWLSISLNLDRAATAAGFGLGMGTWIVTMAVIGVISFR